MSVFRSVRPEPLFLVTLWLAIGCGSGGGCGGGCAGLQPIDPFEEKDKIEIAGQVRVTRAGLDFLEQNLEPILASALPSEGLDFCIPGDGGDIIGLVRWGFCQDDVCPDGQRGCLLNLGIESVSVGLAEPSEVQATVRFSELGVRIPISANPIVDCSINVNGEGFELMLPVSLETPEPNRYLNIELASQPVYQLSDLNIRLRSEGGGLSFLCTAIDGVINLPFIGDLIFDAIQDLLDGFLFEQLATLFDSFTCKSCEQVSDCQDYSADQCDSGICRKADGDCVVAPLGIEGGLDLAQLLGSLLMTPNAPLDLMAVPGSFVNVEQDGLSMGLIAGFRSPRNRCVPPVAPTEIEEQSPSELLRGGMANEEEDFQLGFGLTRSALDRLLWSFYNTGGLCIQVGGDTISQLNTSLLGVIFPDLANLARNPRAPVAITISPQNPPKAAFGANTIAVDDMGVMSVDDPLLSVGIEGLWLDFHVFMDDRWVRFASLHTDINLPLAIDFTSENALIPLLGDLSQALGSLRVENTDLLRGNNDLVVTLLPMLINVFAGGLLSDLVEPIELPAFLGFELDLENTQFTGIEDGEMLAVFTGLRTQEQALTSAVETSVEIIDAHLPDYKTLPRYGLDAWKAIWVDVNATVWDSGTLESDMELSYQVDGLAWSPFEPAGQLRVRSPQFLLQGWHTIRFRGRRVGDYRSLDVTPFELPVLLDNVEPKVEVSRSDERAQIIAHDLITPQELLRVEVKGPDGRVDLEDDLSFELSSEGTYTVLVFDEANNHGETRVEVVSEPLIGRPSPEARGADGCGCRQADRPPALSMLLLLLVLGVRRRRQLFTVCIIVGLVFFLGCEDEAVSKDQDNLDRGLASDCREDLDCSEENHVCLDGLCGVLECAQHGDCRSVSCSSGEALCLPEGICACLPNCDDACDETSFCCQRTNTCQPLVGDCASPCAEGYERTQDLLSPDSYTCEVPEENCNCDELPPIETGLIGRYASVATDGSDVFVSAYEEGFGDLVVGKLNQDERIDWMWVDGVPDGAPIVAGPTGPRGGVELPGADVGRYTSLAVDGTGALHVTYYGAEPGTLYYALGTLRDDGSYDWETVRLDEAGDAGRWASISVDAEGRPGIAYHVRYLNGLSQLRYIFASVAEPINRADWASPFVIQSRGIEMPGEQATETYPEGTGLFTSQARDREGFPVVAWYDRSEGKLWMTRFTEAGFQMPVMLAGWGHPDPILNGDMGANVHLALDADDAPHLCFQDGNTDSLRYLAPTLNRNEWVDDGVWIDTGGRGQAIHVVGDDCQIMFDPDGEPMVIYQDATQQALLMRRRNLPAAGGLNWTGRIGLRVDLASTPRGYGFYASGVVVGNQLWIGHLVYDRESATEGLYELFSVEL